MSSITATSSHRFPAVRWNWAIAAVCLGLLAWFRAQDGRLAAAILLAAAAIAAALMAFRSAWFTEPHCQKTGTDSEVTRSSPDRAQVERTLRWHRTRRRMWLAIAVVGWVAAILGVVLFPPLSLVAAAGAAYAVVRYRRVHTDIRTLTAVLPKLPEAYGNGPGFRETNQ